MIRSFRPDKNKTHRGKRERKTLSVRLPACLLLALLLLFQTPAAFADSTEPAVDPVGKRDGFSAVHYDNTNGLPTAEANDIVQTDEGFIWIGCYAGLVRYDGDTFERLDSTQGVSSVSCLCVDNMNRLWIGTNDNGVALMEKGEFRFWNEDDGLGSSKICDIEADADGNIYVGTTKGIVMFSPSLEMTPLTDKRISSEYIEHMSADDEGLIYGTTQNEVLFVLRDGHLVNTFDTSNNGVDGVMSILPDPEKPGWIYYGTEDEGIYHVDPKSGIGSAEHIDIDPLFSVSEMQKIGDKIWICSRGGIGVIDKDGFHSLAELPLNNSIGHVMMDYEGNLWFTSERQGVMKLASNRFSDLSDRYGLPKTVVNTTCMLDGKLFVGTDTEGLIVIDDKGPVKSIPLDSVRTASGAELDEDWSTSDLIDLLDGIRIRSIIRDSRGRLWISTWKSLGLLRYDNGEVTVFGEKDGLLSNRVRAVYETHDGAILAAVTGGVNIIEGDKVTGSYGRTEGIINTETLTVCEAPDGDILLGSDGGGIYILDRGGKDGARVIGKKDGLTSDVVMRIKYDDKNGVFWLVTGTSIACMTKKYKVTSITNFPYPDNLDLYENSMGEMWILSSNGIYVEPAEDLIANKKAVPVYYGMGHGLPSIVTGNSYSELTEDGDLYISGRRGITKVNIEAADDKVGMLKQAVPYVDADGERIYPDESGVFMIPSRVRKLTVYGFVFNYSLTDPLVSYYLKGFDRKPLTVRRSELGPVSYTNLPGGSYSFVMELKDEMGRGSNVTAVRIVKTRALYEHTWFYVVIGIAAAAAALAALQKGAKRQLRIIEARHKAESEKERVKSELNMASKIQSSILPHDFPPFPDRSEFDIYATMDPAKEVGGDFYDFFMTDDDHLGMVIADVSGKGIPAALFMMNVKVILKSYAMGNNSPAEVLEKTNTEICSNNLMNMFVTVWLGILEISSGKLIAANAGHEYPVIGHTDGSFELIRDKHGLVIGGMDGLKYTDYELQLEPGDKLFVYTDGVPEAVNVNMDMFGTERMMEVLNSDSSDSPEEMLACVRGAVAEFIDGAEPFDDLTMLGMIYRGTDTTPV